MREYNKENIEKLYLSPFVSIIPCDDYVVLNQTLFAQSFLIKENKDQWQRIISRLCQGMHECELKLELESICATDGDKRQISEDADTIMSQLMRMGMIE